MNARTILAGAVFACLVDGALAVSPAHRERLQTFGDEFVDITPGRGKFPASFTMGRDDGSEAERPAHRVSFDSPFAVARYEVPQNLWQAVMGANPSRWKGDRNSVEMLSRAGNQSCYSFGDDVSQLDDHAWSLQNASGNDPPVGAKKPNAWGLYDVHGYLWEWCADTWHDDYGGAPDDGSPRADGDEKRRVLRGGSWKDPAEQLTSSFRKPGEHTLKDDAVGLRCILATEPKR